MQQMDANPRAVNAKQTCGSLRAGIECSCWQIPVGAKKHIEDLPTIEEVLTIFGGPYKAGNSHHTHDRYAKEVRNPP